jgi:hypothetical protein
MNIPDTNSQKNFYLPKNILKTIVFLLVFIIIPVLIITTITWWSVLKQPHPVPYDHFNNSTDFARIIYETRSVVVAITAILTSVIAFFLPLVTILWSQLVDSIFELSKFAIQQKQHYKNDESDESKQKVKVINKVLKEANDLLEEARKRTKVLQRPYVFCIGFSLLIVLCIIIVNLISPLSFIARHYNIIPYISFVLLTTLVSIGIFLIICVIHKLLDWHPIRKKTKLQMELLQSEIFSSDQQEGEAKS